MLYWLQGVLHFQGTVLSQVCLLIVLLISVGYFVYTNISYQLPKPLKILNVFIVVLSIYGVALMLSSRYIHQGIGSQYYLQTIYTSLLPVYAFYYFSVKGILTDKYIRILAVILLIVSVVRFANYEEVLMSEVADNASNVEGVTNNISYSFLSILPILFFWNRHKIVQYCLMLCCGYYILLGVKRGAIIIGAVGLIYMLFRSMSSTDKKRRTMVIPLVILMISIIGYYTVSFYQENTYFQNRFESTIEGDSSGRDMIYTKLINYYLYDTTVLQFLFGSGATSSVRICGLAAHNDWLELLIGQGLFGGTLYLIFFISLFQSARKLRRMGYTYVSDAFTLLVFINLAKTFFSMSFNDYSIDMTACMGYCFAKLQIPCKEQASA